MLVLTFAICTSNMVLFTPRNVTQFPIPCMLVDRVDSTAYLQPCIMQVANRISTFHGGPNETGQLTVSTQQYSNIYHR